MAVLTFQKHPSSGISGGQNFLVYLLRPGRELAIPREVEAHNDPYFQTELASCTRQPEQTITRGKRFGGLPVTAAVVARAAHLLLDSAYSEVEARARRLEALSQRTYSARVSWTTRHDARWDDISCVLLVRLTSLTAVSNGAPTETGMIVLMRRELRGDDGSIITPSYVMMNNSVAVTGNNNPGTVQLNLALSIDWLANGSVSSGDQIALPQINVPLGQPLRLCDNSLAGDRSRCPHASGIFADPPRGASALQIGASVTETGSSANIAQHVAAASEALKAVARPAREAALRRLVLEVGGQGAAQAN